MFFPPPVYFKQLSSFSAVYYWKLSILYIHSQVALFVKFGIWNSQISGVLKSSWHGFTLHDVQFTNAIAMAFKYIIFSSIQITVTRKSYQNSPSSSNTRFSLFLSSADNRFHSLDLEICQTHLLCYHQVSCHKWCIIFLSFNIYLVIVTCHSKDLSIPSYSHAGFGDESILPRVFHGTWAK